MIKLVYLFIFLAMLFYGVGEYYAKRYASEKNIWFAIFCVLGYWTNALLFLPSLVRWNSLAVLGTIWNLGYILITLGLAFIVFHEPVNTRQIIGIGLSIVAVYLLHS